VDEVGININTFYCIVYVMLIFVKDVGIKNLKGSKFGVQRGRAPNEPSLDRKLEMSADA
jgi:hypothetical protein